MALPKLNAPRYVLTIPSTKEEIEFRPFEVKEQKVLLLARESDDQKQMIRATRDLISACTFNKVNPNDLTMFDFEYVFLQIRAKSVGETSEIKLGCSECGHMNDAVINLEDAQIKGDLEKSMRIKVTDEVGIVLRYPRFNIADALGKVNPESAEGSILVIANCIESIYDADDVYPAEEQTQKELVEFVESLSTRSFQQIVEMFQDLPTVAIKHDFKCEKCGHDNDISVEGLNNFF